MLNNRIVVIGGNGFIGRFLINKLLALNYNRILIVDKRGVCGHSQDSLATIRGSFSDGKLMRQILKRGDIVIHLACTTIPATSEAKPERDIEDNIIGMIKLLRVCSEKKINKIIFMSSGGTVYGNQGRNKIKEDAQTNPINSHGVMKLSIEKYICVFHHLFGLNYTILRPSNAYGCYYRERREQGLIDVVLRKAVNNEIITIWGDGRVVRDYIYIDDLIEAIIRVFQPDANNQIFNIGTGIGRSVNQIIDIMKQTIGIRMCIKYIKERKIDVAYNVLDIQKVKRILHWEPKITIGDGLNITHHNILKIQ